MRCLQANKRSCKKTDDSRQDAADDERHRPVGSLLQAFWRKMKRVDKAKRNIYYHCLEYDHEQLGDLFLVACGMEDADPGTVTGPDIRDGFHLHVVRSGKGILRIAGKEQPVQEGQMFILKDGEEAFYRADEEQPWSYCWVTYNGSDARRITEEIGFREGVYILETSIPAEQFFETVRRMHLRPEMTRINEIYQKGIMMEYLAMAMEARCYRGGDGRTKMKQLKYGWRDGVSVAVLAAMYAVIIIFNTIGLV